jgi:hypothetical protein
MDYENVPRIELDSDKQVKKLGVVPVSNPFFPIARYSARRSSKQIVREKPRLASTQFLASMPAKIPGSIGIWAKRLGKSS